MHRLLAVLSTIFCCTLCDAQVQITTYPPNSATLGMDGGWNASLNNLTGEPLEVYLASEYKNQQDDVVLEVQSQPFLAPGGELQMRSQQLAVASIHYGADIRQILKRTGSLPGGSYTVCTKVIAFNDGSTLAASCFQYFCINAQQSEMKSKQNKNNVFSSSGNLAFEQFWAPSTHVDNIANNAYSRLQGQGGITLFDLPFKAQVRLTTEKNVAQTQSQAVTFSFDANEFKMNLRKRLEDYVRKRDEKNRLGRAEDIAKLGELENLKQLLSDTSLQAQVVRKTGLQKKIDSLNIGMVSDSIKHMENLLSSTEEIMANRQQREYLEKLLADYRNKRETSQNKSKIDSIDNILLRVEAKEQGLLHKQQTIQARLDTLKQTMNAYSDWKKELRQLSAKQEECQKLKARYNQLEQFKEQLAAKNNIPQLNAEDVSHYNNPGYLKKRLQEEGMIHKFQKCLFNVEDLSVGTLYPQFSPIVLSGVAVNGLGVSVAPGKFYASVVAGKMQSVSYGVNAVAAKSDSLQLTATPVKHQLISGRVGLGSPQSNHVYFNILHTKTDSNINKEKNLTFQSSNPVFGVDFQFSVIPNYVVLQSYIAYTKPFASDTVPGVTSTRRDLAYQNAVTFKTNSGNTNVKLSNRFVGDKYHSIGVPFLRIGSNQYSVNASQSFWKRQFKTTVGYTLDQTQTPSNPSAVVSQRQWRGGLIMTLRKWPQMQVNYGRIMQTAVGKTSFRMTTWQFISNHSYKMRKGLGSSMILYTMLHSQYDAQASDAIDHQAQFNQTFTGSNNFSLAFNLYYKYKADRDFRTYHESNAAFTIDYNYLLAVDRSYQAGMECLTSFSLIESFVTTVGIQAWYDPLQLYTLGEKLQFAWQISKILQLQGRAQHNQNSTQSTFVEASMRVTW